MTVNPDSFVKSMCKRWEAAEYGLTASKPLKKAWHEIAVTFNEHIEGKVQNEWSVLHLPTGTGKTQGLTLYCSLLAEQEEKHPGVLIITRFTTEADALVKKINKKPYPTTAITNHSDMKPQDRPDDKTMMASPVLVITHSAYKNALDAANDFNTRSLWEKFSSFNGSHRKLVVIDETLDTVNPVLADFDTLRMIRGLLPRHVLREHSHRLVTFDKIMDAFTEWEGRHIGSYSKEIIEPEFWKDINRLDITWLRDELCKIDLDKTVLGHPEKGIIKKRIKNLFADLLIIISSRSWYAKKEKTHSLNSGYVPLPTHISSAVIMDATAMKNAAYDLLGSIPRFRELPERSKLRNYQNVQDFFPICLHFKSKTVRFQLYILNELQMKP